MLGWTEEAPTQNVCLLDLSCTAKEDSAFDFQPGLNLHSRASIAIRWEEL